MKHNPFDLNLPAWGPYGKEYVGLSHVADATKGDRWDCFIMPGYHRRAVIGPYGRRENRWHFWKTAPDLSSYTLRYELEWKDKVYVDVTYAGVGEGRTAEVECVNNSELPQSLDIHVAATLTRNPIRPASIQLPKGAHWIGALDYEQIHFAKAAHRAEQTADARRPGEWTQPGSVKGQTLGSQFFNTVGDASSYRVELEKDLTDAVLLFRYHRWSDNDCRFKFEGFGQSSEWSLGCDGSSMTQMEVALGDLVAGEHCFSVETLTASGILVEGFALLPRASVPDFKVINERLADRAEIAQQSAATKLSYEGLPHRYEISCEAADLPLRTRRVKGEDVPAIVCERANDSVHDTWSGLGERETTLFSCGPIALEPGESRMVTFKIGLEGAEIQPAIPFTGNFAEPTPHAFGMERLAATTFANVVFPVPHRDAYVRHYCPGRWWDCLYTWDSGMLGLGLAALDLERAKDCLNQYLLPQDDPYAAFVEHGTPLPIQAEIAREIWDQSSDPEWLAATYPKLCNFYEWLAGRTRGSTTDRFKSGLLQTWDYNYNSGGWDDLPPQHALIQQPERRKQIAPSVTTSFAIRFAGHMQTFAAALARPDDCALYARDKDRWTSALDHAWDAQAGYYSYVEHDASGQPTGFYRSEDGQNFNQSLDGISPLVAGTLPAERREQLLKKLFDPNELWTVWGATTVSQNASYYSDAGYWNGAVWMPHNYMLWKALREQGCTAEAHKLAKALLGCWEREAQASYHCFELFRANTGRGAGWHQFSGLSAPLLAIYRAEYSEA